MIDPSATAAVGWSQSSPFAVRFRYCPLDPALAVLISARSTESSCIFSFETEFDASLPSVTDEAASLAVVICRLPIPAVETVRFFQALSVAS